MSEDDLIAKLGLLKKVYTFNLPKFAVTTDVFQGRWSPKKKTPDWRWYRRTEEYKFLKDAWEAAGGLGATLVLLRSINPEFDKYASKVGDAQVRRLLGMDKDAYITSEKRSLAQELYERDIFDWWWTTPGLALTFKKKGTGETLTLASGVRVRQGGVYDASGKLLFARPVSEAFWKPDNPVTKDIVATFRADPPRYTTTVDGKEKEASAGTHSFYVFGDSTSDAAIKGQQQSDVWFAQLENYLTKAQAAKYRAISYSYSGAVSGDILYRVRAHIEAIADAPGERTVVLAFGANDTSDAGTNAERQSMNRGPRYQTNTLANLYVAAMLAASRGINVVLVRGAGISLDALTSIAAEMRERFHVKSYAMDWTGVGEAPDGWHRTRDGMAQLAKWLAKESGFISTYMEKPFKPAYDAKHWWRSTDWMVDKINDLDNGWKEYWFSGKGLAANEAFAKELREAFGAFYVNKNQATYDAICALNERWLRGQVEGSKPGERLFFEADAIHRASADGAIYDPDGPAADRYGPLKNPNYKPEPYTPSFDAAHWWRSTDWMADKINDTTNAWRAFWFSDAGYAANREYATKVRGAYKAFESNRNQQTYDWLCNLNERWWRGHVTGSRPPQILYFGADAVRLSDAQGDVFDPDGSRSQKPLVNDRFKPGSYKPVYDADHWWRSTSWMIDKLNDPKNKWKSFWFSDQGLAANKEYANEVRAAYRAFQLNRNQTSYDRLCELNELWWRGKVENSKPAQVLYFGKDAIRLSNAQGDVYDPDGKGSDDPLLNPKVKRPAFKPTYDATHWWRSTAWMVDKHNNTKNKWRAFWFSEEGFEANQEYATKVRAAYQAFDLNRNQKTYDRLCELNERWWRGEVQNSRPEKILYFGADAVRVGGAEGAAFDPDGNGSGKSLTNPNYVSTEKFKPKTTAAHWWRSTSWMVDKINDLGNNWREYWESETGSNVNKEYAAKVRAAYAAFIKSRNQATYDALCALNEQWWQGKVEGSKPGQTLYFGADAVRVGGAKGAVFDPDGKGPGKGLTNPNYVPNTKFTPKQDAAHWWRSTDWMVGKINDLGNNWRKYWESETGWTVNKTYAGKVRAAYAAFIKSRNQATYDALCALNELWWQGKVEGSKPGQTLYFGADAVRVGGAKGAVFDPDGKGSGKSLTNPNYVPNTKFTPKQDAAHWWRSTDWMVGKINDLGNNWRKYWESETGSNVNKEYAAKVRAAYAAFIKSRNQATYDALCALNEQWWQGKVEGSKPGQTLYFGADAVRVGGAKGAVFDPDGKGSGKSLTNPNYVPNTKFTPKQDAAHWWRSTDWMVGKINDLGNNWRKYWESETGWTVNKTYAGKVRAAYAAFIKSRNQATYDALCALNELWWQGKVEGSKPGQTLYFGADAVRVGGAKGAVFDPDGKGSGKSLTNPNYVPNTKFTPKQDAAHWWRSTDWMVGKINDLGNNWRKYWESETGWTVNKTYAGKVRAAYAAFIKSRNQATYDALCALNEQWWQGKVEGSKPDQTLYFGADAVRVGGAKGAVFDPDGKGSGKSLTNPNYVPNGKFTPKQDAAHWWRSTDWMVGKINDLGNNWRKYWESETGWKVNKTYAGKVRAAYAAFIKSRNQATYDALCALNEQWWQGKVEGSKPDQTLYFGADAVRVGGAKGAVFDPDGKGPGKGLTNTNYVPNGKFTPTRSAAYWWRSTSWMVDKINDLGNNWRKYWESETGWKVNKDYAAKVRRAYAAFIKSRNQATYDALCALNEQWWQGKVEGSKPDQTLYFGADAVRVGGAKGAVFDPDGKGPGKGLTNPNYVPNGKFTPTRSAAYWWRSTSWMVDKINDLGNNWRKYWESETGWKVNKDYAAKVRKAYAAFIKSRNQATYDALCALNEQWWQGKVEGSKPDQTLYFGSTAVRIKNELGAVYDPDGDGKKYAPLINTPSRSVLILGDSLSDTDPKYSKQWGVWTTHLVKQLAGTGYSVDEEAVTGSPTRDAVRDKSKVEGILTRFNRSLEENPNPHTVVIAAGVNNLRVRLTLEQTRDDIEEMITRSLKVGANVVLVGMYLPPGLQGRDRDKYISAAEKEWLKKEGLPPNANGWSIALHRIYFDLYLKYKGYKNFKYINNFFDPIDGAASEGMVRDLDQSSAALARLEEGLNDLIHPELDYSDDLFKHIWKTLGPLLTKPSAGSELPIFNLTIKAFTAPRVKGGDKAVLDFEFTEGPSEDSRVFVKFWAEIDKDGTMTGEPKYGESGYVDFKKFDVSFDNGKTWTAYDNNKDGVYIEVPEGATKFKFRFSTFAKAEHDFTLNAKVGSKNNPSTYTVFVESKRLFVRDYKATKEASIADIRQGEGSNTCYFLAALQAVVNHGNGNEYLRSRISVDGNGDFIVRFGDEDFKVSRASVTDELWSNSAAKAGQFGRELWVRVVEYAWLKYRNTTIDKEGNPELALEALSGRSADQINGGASGVTVVRRMLELNESGARRNHHYIVVGTWNTLKQDLIDRGIRANHAYAVTDVTDGEYTLWDTVTGKSIKVSAAELEKMSERFFVTDWKNGDVNPITENTEKGTELTVAKPQIYARAYIVVEHKNKDVDPTRSYHTYLGYGPKKTPDGYTIDYKALAKEVKRHDARGIPFGSLSQHYGPGQTSLFVPREAMRPNGKMGVAFEWWVLNDDGATGTLAWRCALDHDPKMKFSYRIVREFTMGIDARFYYKPGEPFEDEMRNRTQGGAVMSLQQNYEALWEEFSPKPGSWQKRYRVRFSVAGEVFTFGSNSGGGLKASLRMKGQVQAGWMKGDYSVWATLGFDIGAVFVALGDFSSSFNKLIEASRSDDRAEFNESLAKVLSNLPNMAAYIGPTVLVKDGVKRIVKKYVDNNQRARDEKSQGDEMRALFAETAEEQEKHYAKIAKIQKAGPLERFLVKFSTYFHNYKFKFEAGGIWFTTGTKPGGGLAGDGLYGGTSQPQTFADDLWSMLKQAWSMPDTLQKYIDEADFDSVLKMLPPDVVRLIETLQNGKSFWDAVNQETWLVRQDGGPGGFGAKAVYRSIVASMSASTQEALLMGALNSMMDTVAQWIIDGVEAAAEGKDSSKLRLPNVTATSVESLVDYSAYLATRAGDLLEGALKSMLSHPEQLAAALGFMAAYLAPAALEKIIAEYQKVSADSAHVKGLNGENIKEIRRAADYRAYQAAGVDNKIANDLADGKAFESIVSDYKLDVDERAALRTKMDRVATDNPLIERLTNAADDAFRTFLDAKQIEAFDAIRGLDPSFTRTLSRQLVLSPDKAEDILRNLAGDKAVELGDLLKNLAAEIPDNEVIGRIGNSSGLDPNIRDIARMLQEGPNPMSADEAADFAKKMFENKSIDWNDGEAKTRAVDYMKSLRSATDQLGGKIPFSAGGTAAGAALALIPFAMALSSGDEEAIKQASAELLTNATLLALELAAGPVGWAFAIITTTMSLVEKPVNQLIKKEPLYLLIPAVAVTFAFNKAINGITKIFATVLGPIISIFKRDRKVTLDPLTPAEVAMMAYKDLYDQEYRRARDVNGADEEQSQNAGSAAVMMRLIAEGVVTRDSFIASLGSEGQIDPSVFKYDLNMISSERLAEAIMWDALSSCFDVYSPILDYYDDPVRSKQFRKTNRSILLGVFERWGNNPDVGNRDQMRFYSHWLSLGSGMDDIFESQVSWDLGNYSGDGYAFIESYRKHSPFDDGRWMTPSRKLIDWLVALFNQKMLRFRDVVGDDGQTRHALTFGNDLSANDVDPSVREQTAFDRKTGFRTALMAYSKIWGNKDELVSTGELAEAFNDMLAKGMSDVDEQWVDFVVSTYNPVYSSRSGYSKDGLNADQLWHLIESGVIYYDEQYRGMGIQPTRIDEWFVTGNHHLSDLIVRTWGKDYGGTGTGKIELKELEHVFWRLGAVDSDSTDNSHLVQFLMAGFKNKWVKELNNYDLLQFLQATGDFNHRTFEFNMSKFGAQQFAQAVKYLGKRDDGISADDILTSLQWLLKLQPFFHASAGISVGRDDWYYTSTDLLLGDKALYHDMVYWMASYDPDAADGSMTFAKFTDWVFTGAFDWFLSERTPERDHSKLAGLQLRQPYIYQRYKALGFDGYSPVVLDLDGDGLHFTSLANSAATYDVDGSGVRRHVSWIGAGDGLLALDVDGDGRINKTNEISFVGYKPGARTDLEGLAAFDTDKDGTLDADDKDWRKFVIWIDRNGDGTSEASELVTLDKLGVTSIGLTSDGRVRTVNDATIHGVATFTTKDGRTGAVGDVSFAVGDQTLSDAEIARRRDLLAQALAMGKPKSGPGVFESSSTPGGGPNLLLPTGGR